MLKINIFCKIVDQKNPADAQPFPHAVTPIFRCSIVLKHFLRGVVYAVALLSLLLSPVPQSRGEALLELFQQTWPEITAKMPELAEAGYDAIYVPVPCKGNSGGYSVGYDVFDPFDLGSTNQQGTVATMYGTQAQLVQMVIPCRATRVRALRRLIIRA
jgi:hypothetical protein